MDVPIAYDTGQMVVNWVRNKPNDCELLHPGTDTHLLVRERPDMDKATR